MKNKWPFIVVAAALALRLAYLFSVGNTPVLDFLQIDAQYYHDWASRIAAGDLLGGTRVFSMAPFYAYFLAIIYWLLGASFFKALLIQTVIGSLSCLLVFFAAKRMMDGKTAIAAGLLAAAYPVFIFYDGVLLKENLMVFTLLAFVLAYPLAPADSREDVPHAALRLGLAGVAIGAHALMRPNIFLLLPLLFACELLMTRRFRPLLRKFLVLALGVFVMVFPVALRNRVVGGEWVITVASGGMNFWTGNNARANGAYVGAEFITSEEPEYEEEDFRKEASRRSGRELTIKQASDFWYREGMHFIATEPVAYLRLLWRKWIAFIHTTELPSDLSFYFARDFSAVLQFDVLSFGLIAPLGIVGMYLAWRRRLPANYLLLSVVAANLLSSLIFFNSSRYRLPAVPVFILYAGFFLAEFHRLWVVRRAAPAPDEQQDTRRKKPARVKQPAVPAEPSIALLAALTVPFFVLCNYPDAQLARIASRRVSYLNAASYYMIGKHYDKAERMLAGALKIDPQYSLAYEKFAALMNAQGKTEEAKKYAALALRYGDPRDPRFAKTLSADDQQAYMLFKAQRYQEAADAFLATLKANPGREKELRNNIGLCYLRLAQYDRAKEEFSRSIALDTRYDKAYYNLGLVYEKTGDRDKAREYFRKTLAVNPAHEKARQKLSRP